MEDDMHPKVYAILCLGILISCTDTEKNELPTKIVIEHANYKDYPGCQEAFNKLNYNLVGRSKNNSFYQLSSDN